MDLFSPFAIDSPLYEEHLDEWTAPVLDEWIRWARDPWIMERPVLWVHIPPTPSKGGG